MPLPTRRREGPRRAQSRRTERSAAGLARLRQEPSSSRSRVERGRPPVLTGHAYDESQSTSQLVRERGGALVLREKFGQCRAGPLAGLWARCNCRAEEVSRGAATSPLLRVPDWRRRGLRPAARVARPPQLRSRCSRGTSFRSTEAKESDRSRSDRLPLVAWRGRAANTCARHSRPARRGPLGPRGLACSSSARCQISWNGHFHVPGSAAFGQAHAPLRSPTISAGCGALDQAAPRSLDALALVPRPASSSRCCARFICSPVQWGVPSHPCSLRPHIAYSEMSRGVETGRGWPSWLYMLPSDREEGTSFRCSATCRLAILQNIVPPFRAKVPTPPEAVPGCSRLTRRVPRRHCTHSLA